MVLWLLELGLGLLFHEYPPCSLSAHPLSHRPAALRARANRRTNSRRWRRASKACRKGSGAGGEAEAAASCNLSVLLCPSNFERKIQTTKNDLAAIAVIEAGKRQRPNLALVELEGFSFCTIGGCATCSVVRWHCHELARCACGVRARTGVAVGKHKLQPR